MGNVTQEVKTIHEIFNFNLEIPNYQRPYRWKADKHVLQLLDDLKREQENDNEVKEYRIGSVILHKPTIEEATKSCDVYNIVDGQQRLLTLTLILHVLGKDEGLNLMDCDFPHLDSKNNLLYNYRYIQQYFHFYTEDRKEKLVSFILNKCSVVCISLIELSEAFQLFDSQNARGKALEPSDLLKAFHLREMEDNTSVEKNDCVVKWEKSIDEGYLNLVMSKVLYRLRKWKNKDWEYFFNYSNIEEFKGINLIKSIREGNNYPFINIAFQNSMSTNFQLLEPIVNGKRFFDYVDYYVQQYKIINDFIRGKEHNLKFNYTGCHRIGDRRLKYLYINILMFYYDKFGKDSNFIEFATDLYRWVYIRRLYQSKIYYQTIVNLLETSSNNPINLINSWYNPDVIAFRRIIPLLDTTDEKSDVVNRNKEIHNCIKSIEEKWQKQ